MLTLIMLVSLVPATALTASAATLKTSESAITIMKKLTPFKGTCYQVGNTSEFRIGYGTVCNEKHDVSYKGGTVTDKTKEHHTMNQTQADKALRKVILDLEAKVNSFASSNKVSLSQNQFDALVLFTFDCGDSWMKGSGVLKSAVVTGADAPAILTAMEKVAGKTDDRFKIEANMFANNVRSDVVPTCFGQVTYNANGGYMAQGSPYTMYFDTTKTTNHITSPSKDGYKFMGWYTEEAGGSRVYSLTSSCKGKNLYAAWQSNDVTANSETGAMHAIAENLSTSQLASKDVYSKPSTKDGTFVRTIDTSKETTIRVKRDFVDASGNRWCKIVDKDEWVLVNASGTSTNTGAASEGFHLRVTVTNSYVNLREKPTAASTLKGSFKYGDSVKIIATNDAKTWGQVQEGSSYVGWIALMYTDWNTAYAKYKETIAANTPASAGTPVATAIVTANGYLNVRSDPGVGNRIVGSYAKSETVDVFEIRTVNGHRWGRTEAGWICLTFTSVNMLTNNVTDSGEADFAFEVNTPSTEIQTYSQPDENSAKADKIAAGTTGVKIANTAKAGEVTWVKAYWSVKEKDKDGKDKTVAKSGWARLSDFTIVPTKFTVVSDTLNIREEAGSDKNFVFKLTKGVEVQVTSLKLVGEELWGKVEGYKDAGTSINYDGWINLASNYVKRSSQITIDKGTSGSTSTAPAAIGIGTVVNADTVRVRASGALSGKQVGSINRGTKVSVLAEKDGWYKIDYDVDNDAGTESWMYGRYLDVKLGATDTTGVVKPNATGTGIIANTYSGVNVRNGAGIGNAIVGKILNGTQVEILEVQPVGTTKWGRVKQGWICMDYVTMISYDDIPSGNTGNSTNTDPSKGTPVDSFDNAQKTTTTAVYTGTVAGSVQVCKEPDPNLENNVIRTTTANENVTIHELMVVTKEIYDGEKEDSGSGNDVQTVVKQTTYWARVNDGWIQDPQTNISLDALDEETHTVTGSTTLNVRKGAGTSNEKVDLLKKGDQVPVTDVKIVADKDSKTLSVWGRVETADGIEGYCDLSYMSEGALYEKKEEATTPTTAPTTPSKPIGSTGNTGDGGFVGTGGYKYTGKVINTESLNVRVTPSTGAGKATTLKKGANLVIYETKISEDMAWGRCDAGWVYLYYVDMTPASGSAIDARVVFNDNTLIYSDNACSSVAGTYARMAVIDVYEYVGDMARTDLGWVSTANLL
ncbi:MAG: SH3 domain-containing protein [Firmicutes bacterium]|nr:SH3 domain-containing protein [Bacillota bacterium]